MAVRAGNKNMKKEIKNLFRKVFKNLGFGEVNFVSNNQENSKSDMDSHKEKIVRDGIKRLIRDVLSKLNLGGAEFSLEHPEDLANGDYSCNVAMVLAKKLKTNPKDFSEKLVNEINKNLTKDISKAEAKSGFVNFYLSRQFFAASVEEIVNKVENVGKNNALSGKKIMIEYTDPNPFKPFHIGHLMTNSIGESLARILEYSGAKVWRVNYQGDVGLHVAKAMWGLINNSHLAQDDNIPIKLKAANIGAAYAFGSEQYDKNDENKKEIDEINKKIYDRSDKLVNKVYDWGFRVTMEAFEDLYRMLGTKFDYYFLESQMAPIGEKIVRENTGKIFQKSSGAIVFRAEEHDPKLHTRVFITSAGLPTYETKELGLTVEKFKTCSDIDLSIVVTADEQTDYMRVVAKAISLIYPDFGKKMKHVAHGMMRFAEGKMGSRKGNVITGESLLNDVRLSIIEKMADRNFSEGVMEKVSEDVAVSAVKYSILKQSMGGDIVFDMAKSISFEGDSGPYLQYSFARANSVLEKAQKENIFPDPHAYPPEVFEVEKLLYKFPEIVLRSSQEYKPHYITNYLIEIARAYNSFYGNTLIVDKKDLFSSYKITLTYAFSFVMKTGLHLLGIQAPKRM